MQRLFLLFFLLSCKRTEPMISMDLAKPVGVSATESESTVDVSQCSFDAKLMVDESSYTKGENVYATLQINSSCKENVYVKNKEERFGCAVMMNGPNHSIYFNDFHFEVTGGESKQTQGIAPQFGMPSQFKGGNWKARFQLSRMIDLHVMPVGTLNVVIKQPLLVSGSSDFREAKTLEVEAKTSFQLNESNTSALNESIDRYGKKLLQETDFSTSEAFAALGFMGTKRSLHYFMQAFEKTNNGPYLIPAIGYFKEEEALSLLQKELSSEKNCVYAATALQSNTYEKAWEILWAARSHENADVRRNVFQGLSKRSKSEQKNGYTFFLEDEEEALRTEAKRRLGSEGF